MKKFARTLCTALLFLLPAWGWAQSWSVTTVASTDLSLPYGLASDRSGNVFVADTNNYAVHRYAPDANGNYTKQADLAAGLERPRGVAVDDAGNVYVAETGGRALLRKYAPSGDGGYAQPVDVASGVYSSYGVSVDGAGNVYVAAKAGASGSAIRKYAPNPSGGYTRQADVTDSSVNNPSGAAVDSAGNVFVADTYNNAIRKYSPNGNGYLKQADVASTGLSNPYGVAVDSAGNVFVADTYNNAIRKYTPDGSGGYVKQADVVNSGLSTPFGVSVDSAGNVYIASTYSNHILRAVAQASVALASSSNPAPAGQNPVFTATVTPGNTSPQATGTVTFLDGSTQIGTAVLTSGQATLTGSALGFGTHYITARYEGDRDNAGATSSALALTVSSYAVTPGISAASPAGASTFTCADTVVPPGGGTTCTAVPATGYTLLALTGCDSVNLTTGVCGFTGVLANKTPVARFGLFLQGTTVPGAEAGTDAGGPASARVENGGPSCSFDPASTGFEAASAMPAGKLVPQGVFRFKLVGCTPGSTVRITTTWPQAVTDFAKYGKAASNAANASFFAPANLVISGNTVSFDVTDGQLGDDDWAQNGEIVDPVTPLSMAADLSGRQAIPTLSEWGLLLLALLSGALGAHGVTARRRRISLLRLNRMR